MFLSILSKSLFLYINGMEKKKKSQSVEDRFVSNIIHSILSGEKKKGDKLLPERELAKDMGISRSTVNHGLVRLQDMGFIIVKPRHGTIVADYRNHPTPESLEVLMNYGSIDLDHPLFVDLMETRILLEKECTRLSVNNIYPSTISKMEEYVSMMEKGAEYAPTYQYLFHYELTKASGNVVYSMIFRGFEKVLKTLISQHYTLHPEDWKESAEEHRKLVERIKEKNSEEAEKIVVSILSKGQSVLEKRYD